MSKTGNSSSTSNDDNDKKGDNHDPDVVPPDLDSAQQKARERGRWISEALVRGGVSGAVRAILQEGFDHLGF